MPLAQHSPHPRSLALAVLVLCLWSTACRPPPEQTSDGMRRELLALREAADRETVELVSLRRRLVSRRDQLAQRAHVHEVASVVARVRGLRLRRALDVSLVDRDFVRRFVRESIMRDFGKAHVDAYVATLARLGLLPAGYDWIGSIQDLLGEQGAGFYDPHSNKLYLREDMPAGEIVLAHEVGHAIQDQHFDLVRMQGDPKDNDDRSFAVSALIEGDATLVMVQYLRRTMSFWKALKLAGNLVKILSMDQQKLDQAPLYVRESLTSTYLTGLAFVQSLHQGGGRGLVNRAFRKPPVSSEQILHPKKYLRGELPVKVTVPDLLPVLGQGWKKLHENTLGEFGVTSLLRGSLASRLDASVAAAGWGGDRLRSYRHTDGSMVLVWRTVWDKPQDAREARDALEQYLGARNGFTAGTIIRAPPRGVWQRTWLGKERGVSLSARGREVVLVDCSHKVNSAAVRKALGL